jgi:hypothetical protein
VSRKIKNTYEAWWFIYNHPKFILPERIEVRDEEHSATFNNAVSSIDKKIRIHYIIKKDKGGNIWAYCRNLKRHALEENLSIFYTKTDGRKVNDDKTKNKHIECWLEFGPLRYDYSADWEWKEDHARNYLQHVHDIRLDIGAATFDEALVKLAKNVLKVYGDYKEKK